MQSIKYLASISSGASRAASLTLTGATSSSAIDGILLTIFTSGAAWDKTTFVKPNTTLKFSYEKKYTNKIDLRLI